MKKETKFGSYIAISLLCLFIDLLLDYMNIPSKIGIRVNEFNLDVQNILISGFITIGLFIGAYHLVDRWEINKHKNKVEIAKEFLKTSYYLCKKYTDVENNSLSDLFIREIGKEKKEENDFLNKYENLPFENHDKIMQFATEGILSPEQYNDYIYIRSMFTIFISYCSQYYNEKDAKAMIEKTKKDIHSIIDEANNHLTKV